MKFKLSRSKLYDALQAVQGAVERRERMPILGNVKIVLEDGTLSLTTTDTEIEPMVKVDVPDGENGMTTVPARTLLDLCRRVAEDAMIDFTLEDGHALLKANRLRATLNTLPVEDFPDFDPVEAEAELWLTQQSVKELIERTQFAMANQDVRYYLNGLLLEFRDQHLRAVATDGHRLAQADTEHGQSLGDEIRQCILPRKAVVELYRLLQSPIETKVGIKVGKSNFQMIIEDTTFTSLLVEGRFPEYQKVIPDAEQCTRKASVDREALRASLQGAAVICGSEGMVRLSFSSSAPLSVVARNSEQGELEDEVDVSYSGDDIEIGFNVRYLLDVLGALPSENALFHLSDAGSSCLITEDGDGSSCCYVVMPMRL